MRIIIITCILAKIKSRVIALAAWHKILKQVNFCDTSELMPPFRRNNFQPIVKQIVGKNVIKFMKFYTYTSWLHDSKLSTLMYSRRILSYKNAPYQRKHRHACCAYQRKKSNNNNKLQLKSSAFNRFASKRVCVRRICSERRVCVEKGHGEKVCDEAVESKNPVL